MPPAVACSATDHATAATGAIAIGSPFVFEVLSPDVLHSLLTLTYFTTEERMHVTCKEAGSKRCECRM